MLARHSWWFPSWCWAPTDLSPGNMWNLKTLEMSAGPFLKSLVSQWKDNFFKSGKNRESYMSMGQIFKLSLMLNSTEKNKFVTERDGEAKTWFAQGISGSSGFCVACSGCPRAQHFPGHSHCRDHCVPGPLAHSRADLNAACRSKVSCKRIKPRRLSGAKICHNQLKLPLREKG